MAGLQIWLVFWPGFVLGILHTLMPCEDKAIFFFYTFGTSRDIKQAFKILTSYGLGLLLSNLAIGTIVSFGGIIFGSLDQHFNNGLGAIAMIVSAIIMLIQIRKRQFNPHSQQSFEITEEFQKNKGIFKTKTALFLGILAGVPPCVFEFAVYSQALAFSASSGVINGIATVFFFGIGTWIGLFPLAVFGLIGPFARNQLVKRGFLINNQNNNRNELDNSSNTNENKLKIKPWIEYLSAFSLIALGILFLILSILQINVFKWPEVPHL
ncbi:MAG: sulfite exporter TauE/SafE family protein [Promethearchaeota archaeon]